MALRAVKPDEVQALALDPIDDKTIGQAREILEDVEKSGEAGFRKHAERLGDLKAGQEYLVSKEELKKAFDGLSEEDRATLTRTGERIKAFAKAQLDSIKPIEFDLGGFGKAGQTLSAVKSAGCYAPGGRYPLPSSVLMTAITARVAGVEKVFVASPRPQPATLAAAYIADVDGFVACGGAHTIGAFAYGLGDAIPSCDVIVGPGNKWVTAAKKLVFGRVNIDMIAGPSECLVLADETADPAVIAADLLAQAEHDTDALPVLVTTDGAMVDKVNEELKKQLETLTTADVAKVSVSKGLSILCKDLEQAIEVTNTIGPEHLEVMTKDCDAVADKCKSYGGLFIGEKSAEVFGDYGAGPNHVLPTSNAARYTGGLSVFTFLRIRTSLKLNEQSSAEQKQLFEDCVRLARMEGLEGHARAAEQRLNKLNQENGSPAPPAKKQKK